MARAMSRLSTTTDLLPNPHPGEILLHEFLMPMALSQHGRARAIGVPPRRINEIVLGKRAMTADTDLRLAAILACPRASSSVCRPITILMERRREIGAALTAIRPRAA
jgi:addiction module HigA family antidote